MKFYIRHKDIKYKTGQCPLKRDSVRFCYWRSILFTLLSPLLFLFFLNSLLFHVFVVLAAFSAFHVNYGLSY